MADTKISDLTAASAFNAADIVPIVQSGANKKVTQAVIEASIDHANISSIGTNSHATIDSHLASTSNPHSVTKAQVGLGSVVNADTTTTANITDSTNKRFVSDAQLTVIGNTSGTNTGDQDLSGYQPLDSQLTSLAGLSYTSNSLKVVRVNSGETGFELASVSGGSGNSFETISCPSGTNPVADSATDTLSLAVGTTGTDFGISGDATTDTVTFNLPTASASNRGALSSADWSAFNGKQAAGNYITALTGDVTASGPGSVASTLATVNSNVGSFTYGSFTVNAKGLVTAASSGAAPLPLAGGTLTGTVIPAVQAPSYSATVTINAASGNQVKITLTGNVTFAAPTSPTDGQMLLFVITQDGTGSRTATWNSVFYFPTGFTSVLSTDANLRDYFGFRYASSTSKWVCLSQVIGSVN